MKNSPLKFASETIHPGEFLSLALPLPQLFSCAPLYMPIKLIHGKKKGPTLLLIAAMYGNEINGTEIIYRLLNLPLLAKLKGTLIAIPVLNVHGLINRSRFLPNGVDLNRHFPGNIHGSNAERLAAIFNNEVFNKIDYCVNFQTGPLNCSNLPMIQFNTENLQVQQLAENFNAPVMVKTEAEPGSIQQLAIEQHKPFLNFVAGEAMRFDLRAIKIGIDGVINIMRKIEMLPEKNLKSERKTKSVLADKLTWITATTSGTNHTQQKLGDLVKRGDLLSVIKDPFGTNENLSLESPKEGIIVGKNNIPLVHEGDSLFQIAVFPEIKEVTDHFEQWQEQQSQVPLSSENLT